MIAEPITRAPTYAYSLVKARAASDHRHSNTSLRLLALLVRWARRRGVCEAYVEQLADELGVTGRTIQNAQARLVALELVRIERRRYGRVNEPNLYHLSEAATPPAAHPRRPPRSRGGERIFTPPAGSTNPDGVLPDRSHSMLRRAPLVAAPHPPRSRSTPSRLMREGVGRATPEPLAPAARPLLGNDAAQAPCHEPTIMDWLDEHPPPNSS